MFELTDADIVTEDSENFSVSFTPSEKNLNVNGFVHGGIMFLVCDEAIGRYVTAMGRIGAASESDIHYYRPAAANQKMTASVFERQVGKRLGVFLVELRNEQNKLLADAVFTVVFNN